MALLQDPRIPCFFGAQSFTVNLEVSPKSPPILWKNFLYIASQFTGIGSQTPDQTATQKKTTLHTVGY